MPAALRDMTTYLLLLCQLQTVDNYRFHNISVEHEAIIIQVPEGVDLLSPDCSIIWLGDVDTGDSRRRASTDGRL
jgi:hypothetical protein